MKLAALLVVTTCIACSSPHGSVPDAATYPSDTALPSDAAVDSSSPTDAPTDAPPPVDAAPPCPPPVDDADGDCVADATDDCPNIADPAQVDLDGDGIGWMCDPFETIAIPGATSSSTIDAASRDDTFAVVVSSYNGTAADHAVVAVSPKGKLVIPLASSNPAHIWTRSPVVSAPLIDGDNHIWWSHGAQGMVGATGLVDPIAGTFTKKHDGTFSAYDGIYIGGRLGLVRLHRFYSNPDFGMFSPQNGALVMIDTGVLGPVRPLTSAPQPTVIYPASSATPGKLALRRYVLGDPTANDVVLGSTVLNTLDEVASYGDLDLFSSGNVLGQLSELPFCIRQGLSVRYVGVSTAGISSDVLPFAPTNQSCEPTSSWLRGHTLLLANTASDLLRDNVVTIRDGIVTTSLMHVEGSHYSLAGDQHAILDSLDNQYVVAPDRSTVTLATALSTRRLSYLGDVVHVAGVALASPSDSTGDLVLVRYRPATGVQRITIRSNVSKSASVVLATTAEGAALVGDGTSSWVVPSTSTTATPLSFRINSSTVFPRGNHTIVATQSLIQPPYGYTIEAYDEPGGLPRFTPLTGLVDRIPTMLGPTWFDLITTTTCRLARVTTLPDGTPTLAPTVNCLEPFGNSGVFPHGTTASGLTVATTDTGLYLLSPTTVTKVVQNFTSDELTIVHDLRAPLHPVVGWVGRDILGGFACLASHPERCWSVPTATAGYVLGDSTSSPDGSLAVATLSYSSVGPPTVTIVRSLGTGSRPPPLF